jgi:hypothetical protein
MIKVSSLRINEYVIVQNLEIANLFNNKIISKLNSFFWASLEDVSREKKWYDEQQLMSDCS